MANPFTKVQVRKPSRNTFNMKNDKKLTMEMGMLIPVLCEEVLPGDAWRLRSEVLVRFAPMVAPVMHKVNVFMHYFFVPNRIVWPNFEQFMSPPEADSIAPAWPHMSGAGQVAVGTLPDYLGLPVGVGLQDIGEISAIPFAGYQKIWNEYFRDQNLQTPAADTLSNGNNYTEQNIFDGMFSLKRRSWMHDYFTSNLPWAQKGAAVEIPLLGAAPVMFNRAGTGDVQWEGSTPGDPSLGVYARLGQAEGIRQSDLYADLTQSSSATINDLRLAMRTQEFLERQARGGSRYIEQNLMQFGVRSSDSRLQRPEFIGSTKNPVIISEVLQTSSSDSTSPQATMAGHGIAGSHGQRFRYYAEEHGYIFCLMSIQPTTAYQQGIPRHFLRKTNLDYAFPVLAHIGEQETYNKELYVSSDGENDDTFGYLPRYTEYRYSPSTVHGEFRTTLAFWHFGRIFEDRPYLNAEFIECKPRQDPFAVIEENNQNLWCHVDHHNKVSRLLPKYGTPTL